MERRTYILTKNNKKIFSRCTATHTYARACAHAHDARRYARPKASLRAGNIQRLALLWYLAVRFLRSMSQKCAEK